MPAFAAPLRSIAFAVAAVLAIGAARAHAQISPELKHSIDAAAQKVLSSTGVPSAQLGIVQGGRIVYTAAYGKARLQPELAATPAMHYPVGSISKQFTAACVLLLVEDGKMSLDDPVSRWFPDLTRAQEISVRMLLSHTSGYSDYAPQDYTIPAWTRPVDPLTVVREWAGKPLDFDPGTRWQYSNTNFVLAALIVQKVSGMPFWQFLDTRVLRPLALKNVLNLDTDRDRLEALGYMRNALGPLRPATLEAPGWYFGDATLAMPVADLLAWDISILDQTLLKPASYLAMETEVKLKDGAGSNYGLAVDVRTRNGHREISHSGEVGGFVAQNTVYPYDRIAVAVLTNQEASSAAAAIARAIEPLLLDAATPPEDPAEAAFLAHARSILSGLAKGRIDRSALTPDCSSYFSPQTISDFAGSLSPLGAITDFKLAKTSLRGGMIARGYMVTYAAGTTVFLSTYAMPDGRLEQFLVETLD
ncbi:MAG: hypothetical protein NVSMB3_11930 [Acidobacteriaceae bacterium]